MGIIGPYFTTTRANVGEELSGVTPVQISNRGRQNHDVPEGQIATKDQSTQHGKNPASSDFEPGSQSKLASPNVFASTLPDNA